MQTHREATRYPDLPHYAWLQEQRRDLEPEFMELLEDGLEAAEGQNAAWHRLLEACQGDPAGMELKSRNGQYALILADASEPGRYRAQMFDARGFFGHATRDTPLEVLELLVTEGYTEPASGVMASLSQTALWKLGNVQANLIAEVNRGLLSHADMLKRMAQAKTEIMAGELG